jgi:ethanolamine transporter EutH
MKKVILTYGLIAGAIVAGFMFATMPLYNNETLDFSNGEVIGYSSMVIALSMVFFGIKSCRDNHFNGHISFGKAVKVGLFITLIAAVMYALAWEICYQTVASDFLDKMMEHQVVEVRKAGGGKAEEEAAIKQFESLKSWYEVPILRFGITMTELLPVGIVITLVSAALLKRKEILPAQQVHN